MLNAVELVVSCTRFLILDRFYCEDIYVYLQVMFWMLAYWLKKMQDLKEKKCRIIKKKIEAFTSEDSFGRCED
jgi:hypothetical protein